MPLCHSLENSQHQGRMETRVQVVRHQLTTLDQDPPTPVPSLGSFKQSSMASDEQAKAHHIGGLIPIHLAAPLTAVQAIFLVAGRDLTKGLRITPVLRYPR